MALIPIELVDGIIDLKNSTDSRIYDVLCSLILDLDDLDLLNDQIIVCSGMEDDVHLEWPHYGTFFDIEKGLLDPISLVFRIHHPDTKTLVKVNRYEAAKTILVSILEKCVNKDDAYDQYRKDRRTKDNSVICVRGTSFK